MHKRTTIARQPLLSQEHVQLQRASPGAFARSAGTIRTTQAAAARRFAATSLARRLTGPAQQQHRQPAGWHRHYRGICRQTTASCVLPLATQLIELDVIRLGGACRSEAKHARL